MIVWHAYATHGQSQQSLPAGHPTGRHGPAAGQLDMNQAFRDKFLLKILPSLEIRIKSPLEGKNLAMDILHGSNAGTVFIVQLPQACQRFKLQYTCRYEHAVIILAAVSQ